MKNIAKGIFSYNPKTDPNDPLFEENDKKKDPIITKEKD